MVTKDDTVVIHYKDYGTPKCRVKKFATNLELLGLSQQVPSEAIDDVSLPGSSTNTAPAILQTFSPSRKRKPAAKWICSICGISYGTQADKKFNGEN